MGVSPSLVGVESTSAALRFSECEWFLRRPHPLRDSFDRTAGVSPGSFPKAFDHHVALIGRARFACTYVQLKLEVWHPAGVRHERGDRIRWSSHGFAVLRPTGYIPVVYARLRRAPTDRLHACYPAGSRWGLLEEQHSLARALLTRTT
jgi:hypothetical protein